MKTGFLVLLSVLATAACSAYDDNAVGDRCSDLKEITGTDLHRKTLKNPKGVPTTKPKPLASDLHGADERIAPDGLSAEETVGDSR